MGVMPKLGFLLASAALLAVLGAGPAAGPTSPNFAAVLTVSPKTAVPNQTVVLLGTGFTPAAAPGGAGELGAHQITGLGASVITVGGTKVTPPNVNYPINFDTVGNWAASITIPLTTNVVAGGLVPITVADDRGLKLTTQVNVTIPSISLNPASSSRKSDLSISGEGFPASNPATPDSIRVSISYAGTQLTEVSPNFRGEIDVEIQVPVTAAIPSSNIVWATIVGFGRTATAIHSVPNAGITVSPTNVLPGSVVTIFGENFPASAAVSGMRAGNVSVLSAPAPLTDKNGKFVSSFVTPLFLPGVQTITATAGGITAVNRFTVTEGPVVAQPAATPQPSIGAAEALESLTRGDNLIRAWNFDNKTKVWTFFDPRPAFAHANTIKSLAAGRVYWIRVNGNQSAVLNGKLTLLYKDWNLVPW